MRRVRTSMAVVTLVTVALLGQTGQATAATPAVPADKAQLPPAQKPLHANAVPAHQPGAAAMKAAAAPAVHWPEAGSADVAQAAAPRAARAQAAAPVRAGGLPVLVGAPAGGPAVAGGVRVGVLDHQKTEKAGIDGLVLTLSPTAANATGAVGLTVDYSGFRGAYGGDWASRLRLEQLPGCAATTPERPECRTGTPVPSHNDVAKGLLTADAKPAAAGAVFAATAGPSGPAGDYSATSLSESAKWAVSTQGGDFTTSYPFRMPPVPGGRVPELTASYSSNAVDGHTAAANNQPSWLGEGWDLGVGSIERRYKGCANDTTNNTPKTGDLCWAGYNATMTLNGKADELIQEGTGTTYHPKDDDGTKVELLTGATNGDENGEYWKVTAPDGVQYFFGQNRIPGWQPNDPETNSAWTVPVFGNDPGEPCHASTFAASWCKQAYRWNLDHVVDPHGNAITYFYTTETGYYGLNDNAVKKDYVRGGWLNRAEYGTRAGSELRGKAPAVVVFGTASRCVAGTDCAKHVPASYPDVPWDQDCTTATCPDQTWPTFWTAQRLDSVTTRVLAGADYRDVDGWKFDQNYPDPGDGSGPALWLRSIVHTGLAGTAAAMPALTFEGTPYANRVNTANDGLPPMDKFRITGILTESGGHVSVAYDGADCGTSPFPAVDANGTRCFPVKWAPKNSGSVNDWFTRYVVRTTVQEDRVGGAAAQTTSYSYPNPPAWAYNDDPLTAPESRTWSQWRGYDQVITRVGDPVQGQGVPQKETENRYFRGMNGDHLANGGTRTQNVTDSQGTVLPDDAPLSGFTREEIVRDGASGPVVTDTITDPYQRGPTVTQGTHKGYQVLPAKVRVRTALDGGAFRTTETDNTYDPANGNLTQVDDLGDVAVSADDRCTRNTYVGNDVIKALISRAETVGVACAATPKYPDNAVSDVRTHYDGKDVGEAPTKGDVSQVDSVRGYGPDGPTVTMQSKASYDDYGRPVDVFDADDRETKTEYSAPGQATFTTTVTDPMNLVTTTTTDPAWGLAVSTAGPDGRRTDNDYDALGRLSATWQPGRAKAAGDGPTARFHYTVRTDGTSWVSTEAVKANGNYVTNYALYDGFLRQRETQVPAWGGGRVVTETYYDSRGLATKSNEAYAEASPAGGDLVSVADGQVPRQTRTTFDGAGRPLIAATWSRNTEQWHTTTAYHGDHTDVTPPAGGTATTTYSDARGNQTELRQYHGPTPSGDYDATKYTFDAAGRMRSMTDPANNRWAFDYDVAGNEVGRSDPDKGATVSTYDNAGRQLTTKDSLGNTLAFVYDNDGRKTEQHLNSTTGPLLSTWTYDTLAKGQLTSSTEYSGGNAYTSAITGYDTAGRPTGNSVTLPDSEGDLAGTYTTTKSYLADGSIGSQILPAMPGMSAETLTYFYDDMGKPSATSGAAKYVSNTAYSPFGEPAQAQLGDQFGSSLWLSRFYDDATRRVSRNLVTKAGADGVVVQNTDYTYDPDGNVRSLAERMGGQTATDTQCFTYDYLARITEAKTVDATNCTGTPAAGGPYPYWLTLGYDAVGNRKSLIQHGFGGKADTASAYSYPAAGAAQPHALQSVQVAGPGARTDSYGYDSAGDTLARPGQTLTWNAEGKLTSVKGTANTGQYVYDASGQLLLSRDSAGTTVFLGYGELHVDTAHHLSATRHYKQGDLTIGVRTSAGLSYEVDDQQGTATLAVDASTLAVTKRRYDVFGAARGTTPVAWPDSQGFVGGTQDASSGLTTLGVRGYDAANGRFVSVDSVLKTGDPQQANGFSYANNNPATMVDADGRSPMPARLKNDEDIAREIWVRDRHSSDIFTKKGPFIGPILPSKLCDVAGRGDGSPACSFQYMIHTQTLQQQAVKDAADQARRAAAGAAARLAQMDSDRRKAMREKNQGGFGVGLCAGADANLVAGAGADGCIMHDGAGFYSSTSQKGSLGIPGVGVSGGFKFGSSGTGNNPNNESVSINGGFDPLAVSVSISPDGAWSVGIGLGLGVSLLGPVSASVTYEHQDTNDIGPYYHGHPR